MRSLLICLLTCTLSAASVTMAAASDQCAEYKETYGKQDKRLLEINAIIKEGPAGEAGSAGRSMTEQQFDTVKRFVEFVYASRQYECGIAKVSQTLQTFFKPNPKFWLHMVRADLHYRNRQFEKSKDDYESMIFYGGTPLQYSKYSWLLATAPNAEIRDGLSALEMAKKAMEMKKDHRTCRTMAASLAELGQFDKAVEFQKLAIRKFTAPKDENGLESMDREFLKDYQEELEKYQENRPWRTINTQ